MSAGVGPRPRPPAMRRPLPLTSNIPSSSTDAAITGIHIALEQSRSHEAAGNWTDAAHTATTALVQWRALPAETRRSLVVDGATTYERAVADLVGRCNTWAIAALSRSSTSSAARAAFEEAAAGFTAVMSSARDGGSDAVAAQFLLTRALALTDVPEAGGLFLEADDAARLRLRAASHNNVGCFERGRGSYDAALMHLERAAEIEAALDPAHGSLPSTCLNISTVHRLMNHTPAALSAARRALASATIRVASAATDEDELRRAQVAVLAARLAVAAAHEAGGTSEDVKVARCQYQDVKIAAAAASCTSGDPAVAQILLQADAALQRILANTEEIEAGCSEARIVTPRPPPGTSTTPRERSAVVGLTPSTLPAAPSPAALSSSAATAGAMCFVARPPNTAAVTPKGHGRSITGAGAAVLFLRRPSSAMVKGGGTVLSGRPSAAPISPVPPHTTTQSLSARRPTTTVTARHASAIAAHQERLAARTARAAESEEHARDLARRAGQSREAARVRREQAELIAAREAVADHQFRALRFAARAAQTQKRRVAAIEIQRTWRGYAVRRQLNGIADASVRIQSTFRAFTVRATQPAPSLVRLTRRGAAMRIQRAVRRVLFVLELERRAVARVLRLHHTARRIQAAWRAHVVRSNAAFHAQIAADMAAAQLRMKRAAIVQAAARARQANTFVAALAHSRRARDAAAARIQALVRGIRARARVGVLMELRRVRRSQLLLWERHAAVLQRVARAWRARSALYRAAMDRAHSTRCAAATCIAAAWRGCIARRAYSAAADARRQHRSAIAAAQAAEAQRQAAAAVIQHAHRSRVIREDYALRRKIAAQTRAAEAQRLVRTGYAMCIQAFALSALSRPAFAEAVADFRRRTTAATLLQSAARGMRSRTDMAATRRVALLVDRRERERRVLHENTLCVQQYLRAASSERLAVFTARRHAAVRLVQSHLQAAASCGIVTARKRCAAHAAWREATVCIQRVARRWQRWRDQQATEAYYLAQQHARMVATRRTEASTQIQATWRGFCARARVRGIRRQMARELRAVLRLQRSFRMVLDVVAMHRDAASRAVEAERRERAALRIQCMWRRVLAADYAEMLRERRFLRHAAAICIQCAWRRCIAQRELSLRRARRVEARRQAAARLEACTTVCTLVGRFWLARRAEWARAERQEAALQAAIEFNARVERQRLARAATRIAATYRGHYERAYVRGLRRERDARLRAAADAQARRVAAASAIQRGYRCYRARAELAALREAQRAAVAAERLAQEERADPAAAVREIFYAFRAASAASSSAAERIVQARRRETASRVLHRVARSYLSRVATAAELRRARAAARAAARAVAAQAAAVARAKRRGEAAAVIQHAARGYLVRCAYLAQREEAIALRASALAEAERRDAAATKIQALRRGITARRASSALWEEEQRLRSARRQGEAATLIQRAYRSASRAAASRSGSRCTPVVACGRASVPTLVPPSATASVSRPPLVPRPPSTVRAAPAPPPVAPPAAPPRRQRPLSASSVASSIPALAESSDGACYASSPNSASPHKPRKTAPAAPNEMEEDDFLVAATSPSIAEGPRQRFALAALVVASSVDSALLIAAARAAMPAIRSLTELQDASAFASRPDSQASPIPSPAAHTRAVVRESMIAALATQHSLARCAVGRLTPEFNIS